MIPSRLGRRPGRSDAEIRWDHPWFPGLVHGADHLSGLADKGLNGKSPPAAHTSWARRPVHRITIAEHTPYRTMLADA